MQQIFEKSLTCSFCSLFICYNIKCGKPQKNDNHILHYTSPFKPPRQTAVLVVCHIWRDSVMAGGQCPCCAVQLRALQPKALNAERLTCRRKRSRRLGGRSAARNTAGQGCRKPKSLLVGSIPTPAIESPKPAEYRGILDSPAGRAKRDKTARTSQRCVPVAGIIETVEGGKGSRRT